MKLTKSKKGFSTIITIISILFIALTFVAFLFMINQDKKKDLDYSKDSFSAIDTELSLAAFVNSNSNLNPRDYGISVENSLTNGQLASMTCTLKDGKQYSKLVENANSFFSRMYKETWRLELIYHQQIQTPEGNNSQISGVSLGKSEFSIISAMSRYDSFNKDLGSESGIDAQRKALFKSEAKGPRVAMMYLPCNDDETILKMVLLLSKDPDNALGDGR
jgi:hypothetical protein